MKLPRVLIAAAALLAGFVNTGWAMPIPFGDREVQLTAREQPIAAFLQDLFGRIDIPVSVSPTIKGAVNGSFAGPAERTWRSVSRASVSFARTTNCEKLACGSCWSSGR